MKKMIVPFGVYPSTSSHAHNKASCCKEEYRPCKGKESSSCDNCDFSSGGKLSYTSILQMQRHKHVNKSQKILSVQHRHKDKEIQAVKENEPSPSKCMVSSRELLLQRVKEVEGSLWQFKGELVGWRKKIEGLMGHFDGSLGLLKDLGQSSSQLVNSKVVGLAIGWPVKGVF